jgi:CheY-like chemotaxis protein
MQMLNDPTGMNVLIVDDEPINLMILERACKKLGMSVSKAQSGIEAVDYCKRNQPDMVFMDLTLPGMTAAEATVQIKQISAGHWIPIVVISELNGREDIVTGLKSGADDSSKNWQAGSPRDSIASRVGRQIQGFPIPTSGTGLPR